MWNSLPDSFVTVPVASCFNIRLDTFYCGFTVSSFYQFFCSIFLYPIFLASVSAECLPWRPVGQMSLILALLLFILFVRAILSTTVCLEINRSCVELNTCRGRRSAMTSLHVFVQHDVQLNASRGSVCGNWYLIGSVRYYTYTVSFWAQANRQSCRQKLQYLFIERVYLTIHFYSEWFLPI